MKSPFSPCGACASIGAGAVITALRLSELRFPDSWRPRAPGRGVAFALMRLVSHQRRRRASIRRSLCVSSGTIPPILHRLARPERLARLGERPIGRHADIVMQCRLKAQFLAAFVRLAEPCGSWRGYGPAES